MNRGVARHSQPAGVTGPAAGKRNGCMPLCIRHVLRSLLVAALLGCACVNAARLAAAELPQFHVPGQEQAMQALNDLHALHHEAAFTDCTLWDGWLPQATLWASEQKRQQYRASLVGRRIDGQGYVAMQQHRGMAHSDGWPFPAWQQSTGVGFHFSTDGEVWAIQHFRLQPLASAEGWEITGAQVLGIDPVAGLRLQATADVVTLTTPAFRCGTIVAPFARLEWSAQGLSPESRPAVSWQLEGETEWRADRRGDFRPLSERDGRQFANVPLYRQPGYAGMLTRYRLTFDRAHGAALQIKSLITAVDTRHPITGPLFVRGSADYFSWTGDVEFLRQNVDRMRAALRFTLDEFAVRQEKHVHVTWVGHDGRSGLAWDAQGRKSLRPGHGVGNNYWDLLPFGAHDALATVYLYDSLEQLARVEQAIAAHAEWQVAAAGPGETAHARAQLAAEIRDDFRRRFWNPQTGRFCGWIDADGRAYDYGFTFVNLEAIHYGLASPAQAESILAWIDGQREVADDTSRGADIYHWRFAPRATTRRNVETYTWVWSEPEHIPWGDQVQDGGAVLGFGYFDVMARLKTRGPNDAWKRLQEILAWFREVQAEGGYRAYYAQPGRGTLQGGGPPGGLGLDHEFLESVLIPLVMVQGFLGCQVGGEELAFRPQLPADWPSLTVRGLRHRERVLDVTADADGRVEVVDRSR